MMELIPQGVRAKIPTLYRTRRESDPMVWIKFYSPFFNWQWYIVECDQVDRILIFYGWMTHTTEPQGRFIRSDLASMRAYFGITIERDPQFAACRLSAVQQQKEEN